MRALPVVLWWIAAGCAPKVIIESDPLPAPKSDAEEEDDGPVAGPRYILEQAPPDPLPEDSPGGGPLQVYMTQVRTAVNLRLTACLGDEAETIEHESMLVRATVGPDGDVQDVQIVKPSANEKYDQCVVRAFRSSKVPAPPLALRGDQPVLVLPDIAFR